MADLITNVDTLSTIKVKYKFFTGTRDQYDKLISLGLIKDNYIIFITDTAELYKGLVRYGSNSVQIKGKTAEEFNADEHIYLENELLLEMDTRKVKFGDGVHRFSELKYANVIPEELEQFANIVVHTHENKDILDNTTASFTTELKQKIDNNADVINKLNSDANVEGSIRNIAAVETAKIVDGEESYNTLKKIAQWISTDNTQSATLITDVSKLKTEVEGSLSEDGTSTGGIINEVKDLKELITDIQNKVKDVDDKIGQIKQEDTTYTFETTTSSTNGSVMLKLIAGGTGSGEQQVPIKGAGAAEVTTDEDGAITVNVPETAASANKLATGRKITLKGAITAEGVIFDGTKDIELNVTAVDASKLFLPEGETLIIDGN